MLKASFRGTQSHRLGLTLLGMALAVRGVWLSSARMEMRIFLPLRSGKLFKCLVLEQGAFAGGCRWFLRGKEAVGNSCQAA